MGKHKSKKSKKEKKTKKHKSRRYSTSSSSSSEEWVEKEYHNTTETTENTKNVSEEAEPQPSQTIISEKREEWMSVPGLFKTIDTKERKKERDEARKSERDKQRYNPQESDRELNPYWKSNGSGLPSFLKPTDEVDYSPRAATSTSKLTRIKHSESKEPVEERTIQKTGFTDKDLNQLGAKIIKAEIMGNTKLANELKEKLEEAKKMKDSKEPEGVLLMETDFKGNSRPVTIRRNDEEQPGSSRKKKRVETHNQKERVRYFADDDKYSLQDMFEKEKSRTFDDEDREFIKLSSKIKNIEDMDDIFVDKIRQGSSKDQNDSKTINNAIAQHNKTAQLLENCKRCIDSSSCLKHLIVSTNETMHISLPAAEPLTDGHCMIIPIRHVACSTLLDENEWSELMDYRKKLCKIYQAENKEPVFFETYFDRYSHMCINCVPLPQRKADLAPMYFKKAIDESEIEWSQNKKLVSLKGKDVRRAIPKGLSYFFVSFAMNEGYAHVIEDKKLFPSNFAQEIIGGILDLHHSKWRKPKSESFESQYRRATDFSKRCKHLLEGT